MDWIYNPNKDNSSRYTLGIKGSPSLFCFGINPSTAEPNNLDNTVKSVERIARRHEFSGWVMLNIYPQRATNPNDMHGELNKKLHSENLKHLKQLFSEHHPTILAAWGTLIHKRPFLVECLKDIYEMSQEYKCDWKHIGRISKDGHPHHPLYLSNQEKMKPFDIELYIHKLETGK